MNDAILITGAGRRVGLHLARTFLSRGIPVIGTYRSERPELEQLSADGADLHYCDFYDEPQIHADRGADGTQICLIFNNVSTFIAEITYIKRFIICLQFFLLQTDLFRDLLHFLGFSDVFNAF